MHMLLLLWYSVLGLVPILHPPTKGSSMSPPTVSSDKSLLALSRSFLGFDRNEQTVLKSNFNAVALLLFHTPTGVPRKPSLQSNAPGLECLNALDFLFYDKR